MHVHRYEGYGSARHREHVGEGDVCLWPTREDLHAVVLTAVEVDRHVEDRAGKEVDCTVSKHTEGASPVDSKVSQYVQWQQSGVQGPGDCVRPEVGAAIDSELSLDVYASIQAAKGPNETHWTSEDHPLEHRHVLIGFHHPLEVDVPASRVHASEERAREGNVSLEEGFLRVEGEGEGGGREAPIEGEGLGSDDKCLCGLERAVDGDVAIWSLEGSVNAKVSVRFKVGGMAERAIDS